MWTATAATADPAAIERLFVALFLNAHDKPPARITLDLETTDDPIHRHQEGRFFHGYAGTKWSSNVSQPGGGQVEGRLAIGNCHDNAVAESFFQLLKPERIRRKIYPTGDDARRDVFEDIELFYSPKRKHTNNGMPSPVDFEIRQQELNEAGV
ncbi:MAG: hypothetical protein Kilf2KO_42140 [Rhodospirillales bacterium]